MKEELLIKFLNGTCSAEESKQVLDWLSNEESKSEFDAILEKHWQSTVDFDDRESYERLLANIHLQISGKKSEE